MYALALFLITTPSQALLPETQYHIFTLPGAQPGDRTGAALAGAGDTDGDGCADVIVGAPRGDGASPSTGTATVFSGRTGLPLLALTGANSYERFGTAVSGAGDVNGDGRADVLVGASYGAGGLGRVSLVSGADGAELTAWTGAGGEFGHALVGDFDADGDGVPDLAVGAPRDDTASANAGRLAVYSGASGALLWERFGSAAFDQLGASVDVLGDLDGDGAPELVVGVPFLDGTAFNGGGALVLSAADGALHFVVDGAGVGDQLGFDVGRAGDVDGDGVTDLVLVAPGSDAGGLDSGAAQVHSGVDGALLLVLPGTGSSQYLSASTGAGDVNGDGLADLLVGAASAASGGVSQAGVARLLSGADGTLLASFSGGTSGAWLGASVAALGDVDGDGRGDLGLGAPGHDDDQNAIGFARIVASGPRALAADTHLISLASGGVQSQSLAAPVLYAGAPYVLLGSSKLATPPLAVDSVLFPLQPSGAYFLVTLTNPGAAPLAGSAGLLDASGQALASFVLGPGADPGLAGVVLYHAYVVLGGSGTLVFASGVVPLTLVP